jgi:hypothetical protein
MIQLTKFLRGLCGKIGKGKGKRKGRFRLSETFLHLALCTPFVYERPLKNISLRSFALFFGAFVVKSPALQSEKKGKGKGNGKGKGGMRCT